MRRRDVTRVAHSGPASRLHCSCTSGHPPTKDPAQPKMPTPQREIARAERSLTHLDDLFGLFGEAPPEHEHLAPEVVPELQRSLLHHERHMTVTLEKHHETRVTLEVLDQIHEEPFYARKILLRHADGLIVQYGIMRFDLRRVSAHVRGLILAEETPLGRILIENDILRRISTHGLLSIHANPQIQSSLSTNRDIQGPLYGRLATILCNESPAVDLLEVVTGL